MKINQENIERLYRFTREHFVEHYDVQTELVDHLANGIEQQWTIDPTIPFEDALNREFKKFGVFGFSELVEQRSNSILKMYLKTILKLLIKQFTQLKLFVIYASLGFITYLLLVNFKYAQELILATYIIMFFACIIIIHKGNIRNKQIFNETGKKYIADEFYSNFAGSIFFLVPLSQYTINFRYFLSNTNYTPVFSLFISLKFVFIVALFYLIFIYMPKNKHMLLPKNLQSM